MVRRLLTSALASLLLGTTASAQGIIDTRNALGNAGGNLWQFISETLMMPTGGAGPEWLFWFAAVTILILVWRTAIEHLELGFSDNLGNNHYLSNRNDEYVLTGSRKIQWFLSVALGLATLGTLGISAVQIGLAMIVAFGGGILILFAIALIFRVGGIGFLGSEMSTIAGHARQSFLGGAANQAMQWAANRFNGPVQTAWNKYQSIPRCKAEEHLNPGRAPGDVCRVDGCTSNVYHP